MTPGAVSAVVVSYADPDATRRAIASLLDGTTTPEEVIVVDNHPEAPLRGLSADRVRVIHSGANLGYTGACNLAAAHARGEWLFFLNPDARADRQCLERLLEAAGPRDAILGAQVLLPDERVNAGDNPLHITGISWAGRYGAPRESGPAREVAAVSGAALLARATVFDRLGGLCERFFLYQDDADLCWRARLSGWTVRFCPGAVVVHDYEFDKGERKWYWLERNRLWSVLANYSIPSLVLLAPLLLAAEAAVAARARREGWGRGLLAAWASNASSLREFVRWRRRVQAQRTVRDSALLELMATRFETELLASPAVARVGPLLDLYGSCLRSALRSLGA